MNNTITEKSAVLLVLTRYIDGKPQILLQLRQNTKYGNGKWDLAATGHVEPGESMKMALIREAKEEIGIEIDIEDVHFLVLMHVYTPSTFRTYYNAYFKVDKFKNSPRIIETEKCGALQWFDMDNLPINILTDRKQAIENILSGIHYSEIGWGGEMEYDV